MSRYLSSFAEKKHNRHQKWLKRKKEMETRQQISAPLKHISISEQDQVEIAKAETVYHEQAVGTLTHQPEQRVLSTKRIAFLVSVGLHVAGAIILGIYIVHQVITETDTDSVDMLDALPPQQMKRLAKPRASKRPAARKVATLRMPKSQLVTTAARITATGDERFTIQQDLSTVDSAATLTAAGAERRTLSGERQAKIASMMPTFAAPKFETTSIAGMFQTTNVAQVDFNPTAIEQMTAELSDAKEGLADFLKRIREKIKRTQRYQQDVREAAEGTTRVRFTILRDGTLATTKVVTSSGSKALDSAALAAIRNAAPFPPFPEDQEGNTLHIEIPIVFQLKID